MKKFLKILLLSIVMNITVSAIAGETNKENDMDIKQYVLGNGMTVLVYPTHIIPKVCVQIWYQVGSKDESTGEKGIAHLIEHMIFKGTSGEGSLGLSESDINMIGQKLSAGSNAFTTYDFTGYRFDLPTHNWHQILPVVADCMTNCSFKDEHLNSEMKAVIQELKMRKDNYILGLVEAMFMALFSDHPYHYPIIGFKQDLWNVNGSDLRKFYKKHYVPNNATLIVVGDVDANEVFELAKNYFGHIAPNLEYKRPEFYLSKDIASKSITLYRDVAQPVCALAYVFPGMSHKTEHLIDLLSYILGSGKSSRLYKTIVDEQQLATSLSTSHWSLFEYGVFFVLFEPKNLHDTDKIITLVQKEIDNITAHGITEKELTRAVNQSKMKYYSKLENMQKLAYDMGQFFLATNDKNYVFEYLNQPLHKLQNELHGLLKNCFRSSITNKGMVLPLPEEEKKEWLALQAASDLQDEKILSVRQRSTEVEGPSYVNKIKAGTPGLFDFPKAQVSTTKNGIKLLSHHNGNTPKINLILQFKAKDYYDPQDKQGLYNFVTQMMIEGTKNYSATQLADELESRGISLSVYPGGVSMSMLSADLRKGLELLFEILTSATFDKNEIEKIRAQLQVDIKNFWDSPKQFSGQLVREHIYKGHPYSKNDLGTAKVIAEINQKDLIDCYHAFIVPEQARLAIVGDLAGYNIHDEIEQVLGSWQGQAVPDIAFPVLQSSAYQEIVHPINRDQVILCFANLSIDRKHPDYDKLLIFDQILGHGALGSMSSRLFRLREQTGLFYTIDGSLTSHADEQPGMVIVKTLVSLDRLAEAEKAIKHTLIHAADVITQDEFEQAKNAILTSLVQYFESNSKTASAFLFLDKYNFAPDYFDTRAVALSQITIADVQKAVQRALKPDELLTFKIGRV